MYRNQGNYKKLLTEIYWAKIKMMNWLIRLDSSPHCKNESGYKFRGEAIISAENVTSPSFGAPTFK
jgi:hypothetical protein